VFSFPDDVIYERSFPRSAYHQRIFLGCYLRNLIVNRKVFVMNSTVAGTGPGDGVRVSVDGAGLMPVTAGARIQSIDVLRGFALLGILVMNIQSFSMIDAAYFNPSAYGDLHGVNYVVWYAGHLVVDSKFMSIFSMLFGAGVILMTSRAEATGRSPRSIHYRRNAVLLAFGLAHGWLLWSGDILYSYAMCGFFVYLFRKLSPKSLIISALIFISIASGLSVLSSMTSSPTEQSEMLSMFAPSAEEVTQNLSAYRGNWVDQFSYRIDDIIGMETVFFIFYIFWRVTGLMLLGMAFFKLHLFDATRSNRFYTVMGVIGLSIGLPIIAIEISIYVKQGWEVSALLSPASQLNYWGSIAVAVGLIGLVMRWCRSGIGGGLKRALASVGQTALTNYLMQTIICTFIFYGGWGLGYFGNVERWQQAVITVSIWVAQIVVSTIWMRYFRFGPFEWLWRTMTYGRLQPMRRVPVNTVS